MVKDNADISTPVGKIVTITFQFLISFTMISTRGPYWIYIVYKMLTPLWKDGVSWLLFLGCASVCFVFSLFNLAVCFFCYKGMRSTLKKLKKDTATAIDETTESNVGRRSMIRRTSIVLDALAQEVNMGRKSMRRSISIMSVDYELDEEEVHVLERRSSIIGTRRSSIFSVVAPTEHNVKKSD